jgi:beta-lactamase regulating signal transducer with metallopeptidase domain/uncharacterized membrane protein YkoI
MRTVSQLVLTFLLNAAWQIALIAAVAAFCSWLLRGTAARYRHGMWVAALALCFLLAALTGANLFPAGYFSAYFAHTVSHPTPSAISGAAAAPVDALPAAAATSQPLGPEQLSSRSTPAKPAASMPVRSTSGTLAVSGRTAGLIAVAYMLFLLYRGTRLFKAWRRTRAIVRGADAVEIPGHIQQILANCRKPIGVTQVRLMCSASIAVPVTVGGADPLIILPENLLRNTDADLLTCAIGHELAHVLRRDFLLNLLYEMVYLPLSFHPAAALIRRRINQTRELRCDELVTEKLLNAEAYARSLVELARSAVPRNRALATITVGMFDADILEERVMTMLRKPNITLGRTNAMLCAATVLFVVPCLAAVPFALRVSVTAPVAAIQTATAVAAEAPREQQEPALTTNAARHAESKRQREEKALLIAKLAAASEPREPEESTSAVRLAQTWRNDANGQNFIVMKIFNEQSSQIAVLSNAATEGEKIKVVVQGSGSSATLPGYTLVQQASPRAEAELKELNARAERKFVLLDGGPEAEAHRRAEREEQARRQSEMAKAARITMAQAIQTATSQQPGTAVECVLRAEGGNVIYIVGIVSDNPSGGTTSAKVLVSALDGHVINTFKEDRPNNNEERR